MKLESIERIDVRPVNKKESRPLYAKRKKIHPKRATGNFRKVKWVVMAVTLAIYYLTPWIRWDRGANAPDQAVLIDLPAQRFYFFFVEIWPQEFYYLTGLLILAAFGLFLITSVAGRVWCGYSCPQTVWTDLFVTVERFVEGDRGARIRLDGAPWTAKKIGKRAIKHALWLSIAMLTGGAWVFYFADAPTLAVDLVSLDAPLIGYMSIAVLTGTTYLLAGFAREQLCIYMCPWPRIQGALLDENSLAVTYHRNRGEARGPYRKGGAWEGRGHCVDCNQCVAACPMGIDIRDGQQLECITCALCIDACNTVMDRVGLPSGLISYDTLANAEAPPDTPRRPYRLLRPRTIIYTALLALVAAIMAATLFTRSSLDVNLLRDRNPLFVVLSDGSIRNGYTLKILNKDHSVHQLTLRVDGLAAAAVTVLGSDDTLVLTAAPDRVASYRVFVSTPRSDLTSASTSVTFVLTDMAKAVEVRQPTTFRGPGK